MRIFILTSGKKATAAYCLPELIRDTKHEIVLVILNENLGASKWKTIKRIFKKGFRIGWLGAINGIRMRKWYQHSANASLIPKDIETICKENNIRYETTPVINCQRTIDLIRSVEPDLGLSLGNSYISSRVFSIPKYGMLNIHGEVLPDFQNAQSVIWQLYEGNSETGYTIHKIDKKIDTGEIVRQERFPIIFRSTLGKTVADTSAEIMKRAARGLVEVLNDFEFYFNQAKPQGAGKSYTTPSIWKYLVISRNYKRLRAQQKQ